MEAFADRSGVSSPEPSGRPRKWPCSIAVGALILLLLAVGVGGGVLVHISGARKSTPPYRMALERVQADRQVIEQLGEPIQDATMLPMINDDSGSASLDFDVAGPKAKAHVRAEARMIGGQWGLTSVEVSVDRGERISLDVSSGEGPSDAPVWSPNAGNTPLEDSPTTPEPIKVEVGLPSGINVQLPDTPKSPE